MQIQFKTFSVLHNLTKVYWICVLAEVKYSCLQALKPSVCLQVVALGLCDRLNSKIEFSLFLKSYNSLNYKNKDYGRSI